MHESVTFLKNIIDTDQSPDGYVTDDILQKIKEMIKADRYWFSFVLIMAIHKEQFSLPKKEYFDDTQFYMDLLPKYQALIEKVDKFQEKRANK